MELTPELFDKVEGFFAKERDDLEHRFAAEMAEVKRRCTEEKEELDFRQAALLEIFEYCGSPLEQIFLFAFLQHLIREGYEYDAITMDQATIPFIECPNYEAEACEGIQLRIFPQDGIERARRPIPHWPGEWPIYLLVDFSFQLVCLDSPTLERKHLVVEIDGHNYHERTQEQARRDRSRDRFLTVSGTPFLRYTGREINANPDNAVKEVSEMLRKFARELAQKKRPHPPRASHPTPRKCRSDSPIA